MNDNDINQLIENSKILLDEVNRLTSIIQSKQIPENFEPNTSISQITSFLSGTQPIIIVKRITIASEG